MRCQLRSRLQLVAAARPVARSSSSSSSVGMVSNLGRHAQCQCTAFKQLYTLSPSSRLASQHVTPTRLSTTPLRHRQSTSIPPPPHLSAATASKPNRPEQPVVYQANTPPPPELRPRSPVTAPSAQATGPYPGQSNPSTTRSSGRTPTLIVLLLIGSYGVYAAYQLYHEDPQHYSWKLAVIKTLPLRVLSRIWGYVNRIELPVFMREPLYMAWTNAFGCRLEDMDRPLKEYKNLAEFFSRPLKPHLRPVDPLADLVSPADSRLIAYGPIDPDGTIEQIKGYPYSVQGLLGFDPVEDDSIHHLQYSIRSALNAQPSMHIGHDHPLNRQFYYAVLYLHPGDYHRYHSPTDCVFNQRRHFPGQLFPVAPSVAKWLPQLYSRQERAVLSGAWKYGFLAYATIGAYNVGGMKFKFEPDFHTNYTPAPHTFYNGCLKKVYTAKDSLQPTDYNGVHLSAGDEVGHFELGSTIVLIFEVPPDQDFIFAVSEEMDQRIEESIQKELSLLEPAGKRIRVGQALGYVRPKIKKAADWRQQPEHIIG